MTTFSTDESSTDAARKKRVKERLENMVWDYADTIAHGYNDTKSFSDAEAEAFARGVKNVIWSWAEAEELDINTAQIDAAIGERLRRKNSPRQKLASRRLNNLIEWIRDKRIRMLDQYESLGYQNEFKPFQAKVWKLERAEFHSQEEANDMQIVHLELRALWNLSHDLVGREYWRKKNWELRQAAIAAQTPQKEAVA